MKKLFAALSLVIMLQVLGACRGGGGDHATSQSRGRELFVAAEGSVSAFDAAIGGKNAPLRKFGDLTGIGTGDGMALDSLHNEIFLCNLYEDSITVYKNTANGNIAPLRTISGGLTTLYEPHGIAVDPVNDEIFVLSQNSIVVFRRDADGNVAPLRTIVVDATGVNYPVSIAVDPANNEILITASAIFDSSIRVYSRADNGSVAPLRIISGERTGLVNPYGIAVDTENSEIFVSDFSNNSITVYPRTANGNMEPMRAIYGANTGLKDSCCIAVDAENNEIFVLNKDLVTVYPRRANGNVAPLRTLSVDLAEATFGDIVVDVKHDELVISKVDSINVYSRSANGNMAAIRTIKGREAAVSSVIAVTDDEIFMPSLNILGAIAVYKRTANGSDVKPMRTFTDPIDWHLSGIERIAVNTLKNEVFILNSDIVVYKRTAKGESSPLRIIPLSVLPGYANDMSLDLMNDEIFVTLNDFPGCGRYNLCEGVRSISVYSRTAARDAKPLRTIFGDSTGLDPHGIAIDTVNNEIFVLNSYSITVFKREADGNVAPLRIISGDSTGLCVPSQWESAGIEVDPLNNEIFVLNGDNSIQVYPRTAEGNVPPIRTILVSNSNFSSYGMALPLK